MRCCKRFIRFALISPMNMVLIGVCWAVCCKCPLHNTVGCLNLNIQHWADSVSISYFVKFIIFRIISTNIIEYYCRTLHFNCEYTWRVQRERAIVNVFIFLLKYIKMYVCVCECVCVCRCIDNGWLWLVCGRVSVCLQLIWMLTLRGSNRLSSFWLRVSYLCCLVVVI